MTCAAVTHTSLDLSAKHRASTCRSSVSTQAVTLCPDIVFDESLDKSEIESRLGCDMSDLKLGRSFERLGSVTFLSDAATETPLSELPKQLIAFRLQLGNYVDKYHFMQLLHLVGP